MKAFKIVKDKDFRGGPRFVRVKMVKKLYRPGIYKSDGLVKRFFKAYAPLWIFKVWDWIKRK